MTPGAKRKAQVIAQPADTNTSVVAIVSRICAGRGALDNHSASSDGAA